MIRCGLCDKNVDDWITHAYSEEHLKNLKNSDLVTKKFKDHFD